MRLRGQIESADHVVGEAHGQWKAFAVGGGLGVDAGDSDRGRG